MSEKVRNYRGRGNVRVSDGVVASIAFAAACEVDGLQQAYKDKMKRAGKYVKLAFNERSVAIDIAIVVRYGYIIAEVGEAVQDRVKAAVEDMTGLTVTSVNVTCTGIAFPKEKKSKQ
jgi:uncharacterized alkaline shock family protein YloU